jgi:two-component sensor histidine kinase
MSLTFEWRERGVRIEELAPTRGFGTKVIERSLPHMLGGTAELIFNPDGVACRLEFPFAEYLRADQAVTKPEAIRAATGL